MVDTGAGVKVVRTNGVVVRIVLVCAVTSGYSFFSSSAEYVNGAFASVFSKASFARARSAVNSSRVKIKIEEFESCLVSFVTWMNWPDLFLKKRRGAQQSARACRWRSGKLSINKNKKSTVDPPETKDEVFAGRKLSSAASVAGLRDV